MKSQPLSDKKIREGAAIIDAVERAIAELRRGKPVIITAKKNYIVQAVEGAEPKETSAIFGKEMLLAIAGGRLAAITGKPQPARCYAAKITASALDKIPAIAGLEDGKPAALNWKAKKLEAALHLMKHGELLPAALVKELKGKAAYHTVTAAEIAAYEDAVAYSLKEVCRAPLNLKSAAAAEIIGFRPASGGREHYAIIVGNGLKVKTPLIRVHSSCYTGDLLASLACDCRDQLHEAIHFMQEAGGGIVLYLMQEGRGIGLVNKLRTYRLQSHGLDTVEANQALGFDDDERPFLPAAEMLKRLKVKSVRLLTNNPRKVKELERFGIKVAERVPHVMHAHAAREKYLSVKSARMGHLLPR